MHDTNRLLTTVVNHLIMFSGGTPAPVSVLSTSPPSNPAAGGDDNNTISSSNPAQVDIDSPDNPFSNADVYHVCLLRK